MVKKKWRGADGTRDERRETRVGWMEIVIGIGITRILGRTERDNDG